MSCSGKLIPRDLRDSHILFIITSILLKEFVITTNLLLSGSGKSFREICEASSMFEGRCIVMAYIVMVYIVMAYIVMAYARVCRCH